MTEANTWVLEHLISKGNLVLKSGEIEHASPHCWRCNNPLIFRMTKQWFINLDKNNLFERAQQEIKKASVSFYPAKSKSQFLTTIACRPHEWCISRQRKCTPSQPFLRHYFLFLFYFLFTFVFFFCLFIFFVIYFLHDELHFSAHSENQ